MSDLEEFRSSFRRGLAKAAKFQTLILPPANLQNEIGTLPQGGKMLCSDAELAGQSLNTMDFRYYGPSFKTPNITSYSDFTLTFLTQENMEERDYFYKWFRYIIGNGSYDLAFRDEYAARITIEKIRDDGPIIHKTVIQKAYPVSVMPLPLSWADDGFLRTMVQFTYTDFTMQPTEEY